MLFHYSFCSLYKNKFSVEPLLLRYLNKDLNLQSDHFYIQVQEQKRKRLGKFGLLADPNRLIITSKYIEKIMHKCTEDRYDRIIFEMSGGTKDEVRLLKKLNKLDIPITVFVTKADEELFEKIKNIEMESLNHFTDIFKFNLGINSIENR